MGADGQTQKHTQTYLHTHTTYTHTHTHTHKPHTQTNTHSHTTVYSHKHSCTLKPHTLATHTWCIHPQSCARTHTLSTTEIRIHYSNTILCTGSSKMTICEYIYIYIYIYIYFFFNINLLCTLLHNGSGLRTTPGHYHMPICNRYIYITKIVIIRLTMSQPYFDHL